MGIAGWLSVDPGCRRAEGDHKGRPYEPGKVNADPEKQTVPFSWPAHPLRGPIFETWVVSEIAKYRTHRGETAGLSFYRDSNGAEADLIIEHPSRVTLVEAKASETPSSTLFGGARRVQRHLSRLRRPGSVVVAYGGDQLQQRTEGSLIPWCELCKTGFWEPDTVV